MSGKKCRHGCDGDKVENGYGDVIALRCAHGAVWAAEKTARKPRCQRCGSRTGHATGCFFLKEPAAAPKPRKGRGRTILEAVDQSQAERLSKKIEAWTDPARAPALAPEEPEEEAPRELAWDSLASRRRRPRPQAIVPKRWRSK